MYSETQKKALSRAFQAVIKEHLSTISAEERKALLDTFEAEIIKITGLKSDEERKALFDTLEEKIKVGKPLEQHKGWLGAIATAITEILSNSTYSVMFPETLTVSLDAELTAVMKELEVQLTALAKSTSKIEGRLTASTNSAPAPKSLPDLEIFDRINPR